ncbi:SDR family oxidoreductase [Amycolatopsis sp. NPDC051372]|uniref:SDR family NAD(P)-dependent oxidoreductase n=1 Tax=unclassified Amycolatopsis TaxID=2618356 RepID=UPI0034327087
MDRLMQDKAVVVTGAGRGLGEAFAVHVARAGGAVVVNDVDAGLAERTAETIRQRGGRAVASGHSVADPAQAQAIVDLCVGEFGRINGLVNNAGLNYEALPWDDNVEQARELVEVNVLGVMYTGLAAIKAMVAGGIRGSIVNISSGASLGQRKLGVYAASKGAVASLTYSWALDLEEHGIRANAVCPVAHTRMVWKSERALRACPPERTPSRIAPVVLFLLGDGSAGITGQMIRCNGPQLHVMGQPFLKQPILERQVWDTETVQNAFDEVFSAHLENYGLEKRVPPRLRKWTDSSRIA